MYCYRCNGTLDVTKDACTKCGTDIRVFKKIVFSSNRHYNSALTKASAGNLSGAKDDLLRSLQLYKKNIMARNLLGLVEYAMGEPAEGLKQWVISKNLAQDSQMADRFINLMRHSVRDAGGEGEGVKQFNQALSYANNGAEDLAVIQLKKLITTHKSMTKAYNLLALLYMKSGKNDQAERVLRKCLAVDNGNVTAYRYLKEVVSSENPEGVRSVGTAGDDEREQLIIPVRFRDYGTYLSNALYVLLGLAIGILVAWFVIVQPRVNDATAEAEASMRAQDEVISSLQEEMESVIASAEAAETALENPSKTDGETEPEETTGPELTGNEVLPEKAVRNASWTVNQETVAKLVAAVQPTPKPDFCTALKLFVTVNPTMLSDTNKEHFKNIATILFDQLHYNTMVREADAYYQGEMYDKAAEYYDAISQLHPEAANYRMMAGLCYEQLGMRDKAIERFWQGAVLHPGTSKGEECRSRYLRLTGFSEVPPVPEGTDIEALTAPITKEAILQEMEQASN